MPKIDLGDFSKIGELPPEGYYRFQIQKQPVMKQNSKKDGQIIEIDCLLIDSPDPDFENFSRRIWPSLKVSARWKLKEQLEAFTQREWNEDNVELEVDDDNILIDPDLEGATFIGLCVHGTDNNNKPSFEIKTYLPDDGTVEIGPVVEE